MMKALSLKSISSLLIILVFSRHACAQGDDLQCPNHALENGTVPEALISVCGKIPWQCCSDVTGKCNAEHNGNCQLKWLTHRCDYTAEVCHSSPSWYCTCCGSCEEKNTNSKCKVSGGRCSKKCNRGEYHAYWIPCHSQHCKCCTKNDATCANGKGYCTSSNRCRRNHYPSKTETCSGVFGCTCCVKCESSPQCKSLKGFCAWTGRSCPRNFQESTDLCCPDPECRCCYRKTAKQAPSC